jgi:predicted nucleic acid-binding protein
VIVVADTSVVLNLCRVQHEHLLVQLFGRVVVPAEVASEFSRLCAAETKFTGLALPGWIEVQPAPQPIPSVVSAANLDAGETAAIALGLSLAADALLIDEKLGRDVANRLGLRTIGILGVLLEARRRGLISRVKTVLDRLETEAGFWVAPLLRQHVMRLAGE